VRYNDIIYRAPSSRGGGEGEEEDEVLFDSTELSRSEREGQEEREEKVFLLPSRL